MNYIVKNKLLSNIIKILSNDFVLLYFIFIKYFSKILILLIVTKDRIHKLRNEYERYYLFIKFQSRYFLFNCFYSENIN